MVAGNVEKWHRIGPATPHPRTELGKISGLFFLKCPGYHRGSTTCVELEDTLVPTVIPPLLPPVASLHNAPAMIEMSDGGDGQGGAMPHAQKASDRTTKNEAADGGGTEPAPTTESGQHASAALLLDLAASAKSASAGSKENDGDSPPENNIGGPPAATEAKPAALIHRQMSDPTSGGYVGYHWMAETAAPDQSHRPLPAAQATVPGHEESPPVPFPPRFEDIGSPFIHAADYAAGVAMRDNVLHAVMSELGLDGSNEEGALMNLVDDFIRGKTVWLERTGSPASETRKKKSTTRAQILPVLAKDAPVIASWYNAHGDKALSYTSKAWNDWWVQRCGHPDVGCEMIKLVMYEDNNDQQKEVILGLAYVERTVVDRYPIEVEDHSPRRAELCGDDDGSSVAGKKRRRDETESFVNSRIIRTTLLRGMRINPKYNPEVTRRLSGLSNKDSVAPIGGIPASLAIHVLTQSLRLGTEAVQVGVHCPKIDTAEAFFQGLFQGSSQSGNDTSNATIPEDEDGRKYFRLLAHA